MSDHECPFCVEGRPRIAELGSAMALRPRDIAMPYHVLLVPQRHVVCLDELEPNEAADLHGLLARLVAAARTHIQGYVGFNIESNNGRAAGQEVEHAHVHLYLRDASDPSPFSSAGRMARRETPNERDETLRALRSWMQSP